MSSLEAFDFGAIDLDRPLLIVDVDEVLGQFIRSFEGYLKKAGYELRLERYALFDSIFAQGAGAPITRAEALALYNGFFHHCEDMDPAEGAVETLAGLASRVNVVVLSNAPEHAREPRRRWLDRHGMAYPLVINSGVKGPAVAELAEHSKGPTAFVDDMLSQLDSAAETAPAVHRFQLVADARLRGLAPCSPQHVRIDDWRELGQGLESVLLT